MRALLVALVAAVGISCWSFVKLQQRSGHGNAQMALKATSLIFIIVFLVVFTIGQAVLH